MYFCKQTHFNFTMFADQNYREIYHREHIPRYTGTDTEQGINFTKICRHKFVYDGKIAK